MDKADKRMITGYTEIVSRVARDLREAQDGERNRELASFYRRSAEDLEFVTSDLNDTLSRI